MTDPAFLGVLAAGSSCCVPHVLDVLAAGAACGDFWQFCAFWSLADFAASKCRHGDNLALLAFGAVSLRLLDLGDPYVLSRVGRLCVCVCGVESFSI